MKIVQVLLYDDKGTADLSEIFLFLYHSGDVEESTTQLSRFATSATFEDALYGLQNQMQTVSVTREDHSSSFHFMGENTMHFRIAYRIMIFLLAEALKQFQQVSLSSWTG